MRVKSLIRNLAIISNVFVVSACGSGGSTSSVPDTIQEAEVKYPDIALKLLPSNHLNKLETGVATSTGLQISTAALETDYETFFCQLNAQHGVTLDSKECKADIKFIKEQAATGNFDLSKKPILNNPLGIFTVNYESYTYTTQVPLPTGNQTFKVSGGIAMPQIDKSKIKGVLVYFHGTTFNKSAVGSNFSTEETQLVVSVFASQGYIVVLPDYVGQGIDWKDPHPYVLYPQVSAKTAIDMLESMKPLIESQYGFTDSDNLKLFSAGYSEGGAYSLWFNTYIRNNPGLLDGFYQLTHSVGMEGAYSTSVVTKDFLFSDVNKADNNPFNIQDQTLTNLVKPALSAVAFLSYASYSESSKYNAVFNDAFFDMDCLVQSLCNIGGKHMNIAGALAESDTTVTVPIVKSALGKSANNATYPVDLIYGAANSVNSLVSHKLLKSGQGALNQTLSAADVNLSNMPESSVSIITLSEDSVVTPNNYNQLLSSYPNAIKVSISINPDDIIVVSPFSYLTKYSSPTYIPVDHLQGLIYEYLYALNIFNQF
jgi:hypothetical protein